MRGDIERRWLQSVLLVVMVVATTATLTIALSLSDVTNGPFARTRAATKGPDVAGLFQPGFHGVLGSLGQFADFRHARGVTAVSGPYPVAELWLSARGSRVRVHAEGRDHDRAKVDQPLLTAGSWAKDGGVVLERRFAIALGIRVGDVVNVAGRRLTVQGVALTTAMATNDPLLWVKRRTLRALAGGARPPWYALNLKLADPAAAPAFADARNTPNAAWFLQSWQGIRADDSAAISSEQQLLELGSALLAMIAVAGIALLVGGRMADQTRRVGLLKAVGGTPGLVAAVLMAENLLLSIIGAIGGLAAGRLIAPLVTDPGSSLLGSVGPPAVTGTTIALAIALAVVVAAAATILPALGAARTSTLRALDDAARQPRRHQVVIELSARLPVSMLLAARLIARRPRRALLAIASVAIAVATFVATLLMRHTTVLGVRVSGNVLAAARQQSLDHVGSVLSVTLLVIGAINLLFTTWATVLDARRPTALARALGATPRQVASGLAGAQLGPALLATIVGLPLGLVIYVAAGGNPVHVSPPIPLLVAIVPGTLLAVGVLTTVPARIGAHRSVVEVLRSD